jgi:hypothetical protein
MSPRLLAPLSALVLCASLAHASPRVFGEAMPEGEAQAIGTAIAAGIEADAAARKFSGRITEVCQAKGCWVMLEDEGQVARVMMKDHDVGLPRDARGRAVVHGVLSEKVLDEKTARHLAEDAGRSEPVATREFRIVATSVELLGG